MTKQKSVTTAQLLSFIKSEDFLFGSHTGSDGPICDHEQRENLAKLIRKGNSPRVLIGKELADMLLLHPDFCDELAQGCVIVAVDHYHGANWVDTYFIAYHQ